jgi:hypothetical protein
LSTTHSRKVVSFFFTARAAVEDDTQALTSTTDSDEDGEKPFSIAGE